MNSRYSLLSSIDLHVAGRISAEDASRQVNTAREILHRFTNQPGLILADEVGMGKTFVAIAVAVSVALQNRRKQPVVVMVPSALKEKWPSDFALFKEKCLPADVASKVSCGQAEHAVQFLKLLDDPPSRRKSVIFLTHGAMSRGLDDKWVMLALIQRSLRQRKGIDQLRNALCRSLGDLLQLKWVQNRAPDIWSKLLRTPLDRWLAILQEMGVEDDDPVPEAIATILPQLDTRFVFDAVQQIPLRTSKNYDSNILRARHTIKEALRSLWKECLQKTQLKLPLLILDEAHHLKNADTQLASLFRTDDASKDAHELSRGLLSGAFERMLFLTATPFQLGHGELCSVLDRFDGICWKNAFSPTIGREGFTMQRQKLRGVLDAAQESAVSLDHAWGRMQREDLQVDGQFIRRVEDWWPRARAGQGLTPAAMDVLSCFNRTKERMVEAEKHLRKCVIRHLKPRVLSAQHASVPRRHRLVGRAIETDNHVDGDEGITVKGDALLPFLLAARATSYNPNSRPVFAEGLASSYEAFMHTRETNGAGSIDQDDEHTEQVGDHADVNWYLHHLGLLIPRESGSGIPHPKVSATVQRVVDVWRRGEKSVIFCHYIATGRTLRQKVSEAIQAEIRRLGAEKLNVREEDVGTHLDLIGKRFFDDDSPLRRSCDGQALDLISQYSDLAAYRQDLVEIIRRNVRTPSFLVRFFPLELEKLDENAMRIALKTPDSSGLTLRQILQKFLSFLVDRCGTSERERYMGAVKRIQTGAHFGAETSREYDDGELQGARPEHLLPNVRLVNGTTRSDTRQRLMLTFNTPFYPEVLVASSVMAEGVDLHLNCRHMFHHDLCWNPSTLEQRTGRVDRIGAKAETAGKPIHVYIPFIAETQDEKMYRVVMDRERWFNVLMSEDYSVDAQTTDKLAERIPFPAEAANELAFRLGV